MTGPSKEPISESVRVYRVIMIAVRRGRRLRRARPGVRASPLCPPPPTSAQPSSHPPPPLHPTPSPLALSRACCLRPRRLTRSATRRELSPPRSLRTASLTRRGLAPRLAPPTPPRPVPPPAPLFLPASIYLSPSSCPLSRHQPPASLSRQRAACCTTRTSTHALTPVIAAAFAAARISFAPPMFSGPPFGRRQRIAFPPPRWNARCVSYHSLS